MRSISSFLTLACVRACRLTAGPNWPTFRAVVSPAGEKPAGDVTADLAAAAIIWPAGDAEWLATAGATLVVVRRGVELVLGVATEARRVLPAEEEFLVGVDATMVATTTMHHYWDATVNPYPPGRMADASALVEARR